jgi:hypothetical protein
LFTVFVYTQAVKRVDLSSTLNVHADVAGGTKFGSFKYYNIVRFRVGAATLT